MYMEAKAVYEAPAIQVVEVKMDSVILQASIKGYGDEIEI